MSLSLVTHSFSSRMFNLFTPHSCCVINSNTMGVLVRNHWILSQLCHPKPPVFSFLFHLDSFFCCDTFSLLVLGLSSIFQEPRILILVSIFADDFSATCMEYLISSHVNYAWLPCSSIRLSISNFFQKSDNLYCSLLSMSDITECFWYDALKLVKRWCSASILYKGWSPVVLYSLSAIITRTWSWDLWQLPYA